MEKNNLKFTKNVAVVGVGYWGKNLVRNYYNLGSLYAVCDNNSALVTEMAKNHDCLALSWEQVLESDQVAAVVIAAPAELHFKLCQEALLAGKHVFVEKPLALNPSDAVELQEVAAKKERCLMVGHLLQYHPVFARLKELVKQGELGEVQYIYSNRLNLGKIRREEDILWSFAPHDISMILALVGEEPESVDAHGGYYLHESIADVTTTHLKFPSGISAHILVSWLHPYKEQKLVVVGSKAMAVFDDGKLWEEKLGIYRHQIDWKEGLPIPTKADIDYEVIPQDEPLRLECEHFIKCFTQDRVPRTDATEGLRVLQVLDLASKKLQEKRK